MSPKPKIIKTPLLEIAYYEFGPADGAPVVLVHGWPDEPLTWAKVAEALAEAGYRVLLPTLRGFGATSFIDESTLRSGQITALAQDIVDFADALGLSRFVLVGHDWGGRAGYIAAAAWPERIERLVVLAVPYSSSTSIHSLSPAQQRAYWYQWLFQTNQARTVLEQNHLEFCEELWKTWMALGKFDPGEFGTTAMWWDNADWIDITLSSYRYRWRNAGGDPRYNKLEALMLDPPKIRVPTILLHGEHDGATLPQSTEGEEHYFTAGYERRVVADCGHFVQREQPQAVIDAILGQV